MNFIDYLENREKRNAEKEQRIEAENNRIRVYNDLAVLLWYHVLYEDVLKYKHEQMDNQQQPFRVYSWGNNCMMFGSVKALTKAEDIEKFEKVAQATLKDKGYGKCRVKAYPDGIVVSRF